MQLENYIAKPDKSLLQHTNEVREQLKVIRDLKYIKNDKIYNLADKACYFHDHGKANREFQKRIQNHNKFNENTEIAHNVLSLYFIKIEDFETEEDYLEVANAVLTHHNYCNESEVINRKEELINNLLYEFTNEIETITPKKLKKIIQAKFKDQTVMVKGLLQRCDYSASAGIKVEYVNDFLLNKLGKMMETWKENKADNDWNELQRFCLNNTDKNIIVTAQTGMGKTEAGLLWLGNNKGFFILPIKTAINAIYDRIKNVIYENEKIDERLALLHSDTLEYYIKNIDLQETTVSEYYSRSKQLSIPLTITTLDQIFDFVFQYSGYEMKLATLSYSKLIIDEIQMYSPDLLAYLIRGIELVNQFGGKVAILTATLSPFVKDILIEKGFMGDVIEASFFNNCLRHNIKVYPCMLDSNIIIEQYNKNESYRKSNKVLVVCNTVKKAQEIYEELAQSVDNNIIHILHNKFIKRDRSNKEKEILEFGQTYNTHRAINSLSGIWITTSIVEASLDIDFDFLFTELSDLNSLFQRFGRINRKGVKSISNYNCFVFTEINKKIIRSENNKKGFIDEKIYSLSKESLEGIDGILSEERKVKLINEYFTTEKIKKSSYMKDFKSTYDYILDIIPGDFDKSEVKLREIITYSVIPDSVYYDNEREIENYIEIIDNKNTKMEDRVLAQNEVKKFTLGIEPYVLKESKCNKVLNIGRGEIIRVIECFYEDIGFRMKKNNGFTLL